MILRGLDVLSEGIMEELQRLGESLGCRRRELSLTDVEGECGMITVVRVERRTLDCRLISVIVRELGEREKTRPVILLIVTVDPEVLFKSLIHTFRLTVSLRVKCGREALLQTHHG
jgi:hypothetical protein